MRKFVIFMLVFVGFFSLLQFASARPNPKVKLQRGEVLTVQVKPNSGESRSFSYNDGYQERVIRKVIEWVNGSSLIKGTTEFEPQNIPIMMTLKMKNGDETVIKPAYTCHFEKQTRTCTPADGVVVFTQNKIKVRLKSQALYDWLLVGWKHEVNGPTKEELLEETLYTRYYLSQLGKAYSDFFMCPRIDKIERINGGDSRSHIIYASALSYSGHHYGYFDKINIILNDTRQFGVQTNTITMHKNISEKEVIKQCKR